MLIMRSLAHIERIVDINPIPDADRIEVAQVLGWEVVIQKGLYNIGDLICFIEVDSLLPKLPQFSFMESRGYKVKTIKLRGQVSQGLIISLRDYYDITNDKDTLVELGKDVTKILGIVKYEKPIEEEQYNKKKHSGFSFMRFKWYRKLKKGSYKSSFPKNAKKTDESRIQNNPRILIDKKDYIVECTEKIDGQSFTATTKPKKFLGITYGLEFIVASRNRRVHDKKSLFWQTVYKYNLEEILLSHPGMVIQGEQIGTKIQGNKYKLQDFNSPQLYIFNIEYKGRTFVYEEIEAFCELYDLNVVPFLGLEFVSSIGSTVNDYVEYSKGVSKLENVQREGVVFKNIDLVANRKGFSFKAINPDFLLKHKL